MQDISRIENDDGTISKYGYNFVSGAIPDLIAQHNYTEAARLCGLLLNASPDNVRIRYLRGLLNQKTGELEQAAQDYDFLIKRGVADAEILNNAGTIYANNKDFEKAEGFFIAAIKKNPGMIEAHNNLADLFLQTEDYSRAIEEYNKVTQKEPENTRALYNLGIAYMKSGKHLIAKEQWEKVLAIKPEDGEAKKALEYLNTKKL
jgi:Flp pilus assembly protein TadD